MKSLSLLGLFLLGVALQQAGAAELVVATYGLQGHLNSVEGGGVPALTLVGSGTNSSYVPMTDVPDDFVTMSGTSSRTVLALSGSPGAQVGLQLSATSLLSAEDQYSLEMVFLFKSAGSYRRVIDAQNVDDGLYVDNSDFLNVFDSTDNPTTTTFSANTFYHVIVTVDAGTVTVYLNGNALFFPTTGTMGGELYAQTHVLDPLNPGTIQPINLLIDEFGGGTSDEYSQSEVALVRLYDSVLTAGVVQARAADPFTVVPEPGSAALLLAGAAFLLHRRRRP